MADKEGKKRKRQLEAGEAASKKKVAFDSSNTGQVKVHYRDVGLAPVLLAAPGLTTPDLAFAPYAKAVSTKTSSTAPPKPHSHDLLLHSSKHPRLDYTATPAALDQHLSHYVAVYDPNTKQLQITPAHYLNLRGTLKSDAEDQDKEKQRRTAYQQREDLGREFGTKKAKKAIFDKSYNAIVKDGAKKGKKDDVQSAVLESMPDSVGAASQQSDLAETLASKPIPQPNLAAENVEDVYLFDVLVPPTDARLVPIKDWQEKAQADEPIDFKHRFPATRVVFIAKTENARRLKAMAYLALLLEFHDALASAGKAGKKVPKKEIFSKKMAGWPEQLVDSVRRRFSNQQNELPKWHMDNLYTHLCALSLYVDGWTTDMSNLRDDLKMENKELVPFFRELGCKVTAPSEKEKEVRGWTKAFGATVRMARLKMPLDFPKPRVGRKK